MTTRTADMRASKLLLNSTISTRGARYTYSDRCRKFYLATPLERTEYLRIAVNLKPQECIDLYYLQNKVKNGYIRIHTMKLYVACKYGLPQARILADKLLSP